MSQSLDRKVIEWRDADVRARAAEQTLSKVLFSQEDLQRPTADLAAQARQLRRLADEKLKAAIAAMRPRR